MNQEQAEQFEPLEPSDVCESCRQGLHLGSKHHRASRCLCDCLYLDVRHDLGAEA